MNFDEIADLLAQNKPLSEIGDVLGVSRSVVAGLINWVRAKGDDRFAPRPPRVPAPRPG
jgi:DNA-binding CsgD family transcriptional regulator